jgi:hypothetical protein
MAAESIAGGFVSRPGGLMNKIAPPGNTAVGGEGISEQ